MSQHPNSRIVLATGLHQDPHDEKTYYWRLRNHQQFLSDGAIQFVGVNGLMSRDFVIQCSNSDQASSAKAALEAARIAGDESRLFECDSRGDSVFCTLMYGKNIPAGTTIHINGTALDLSSATCFVAVKNGQHNGIGYLIDTGMRSEADHIQLAEIFSLIQEHFDASLVAS
jgi:hypothetical protein